MKKIKSLLFILSAVLLLSSCGYEPVFYGIMNDVPPEKATISGNINSIARYTTGGEEFLFLCGNGKLKYKNISSNKHGEWKTYSDLPFEIHYYNDIPTSSTPEGHIGQQILQVASDSDYVYLLTVSYRTNTEAGTTEPKKFYLWAKKFTLQTGSTTKLNNRKTDSNEWINITNSKESVYFPTGYNKNDLGYEFYFHIFSSNSPKTAHRKSYIRVSAPDSDAKYYELNGTSAPEEITLTNVVHSPDYNPEDKNNNIDSAFYIGDTLYFADTFAVTTNENFSQNATYAYFIAENKNHNLTNEICYYKGTGEPVVFLKTGNTAASIAATADSLIIGEGSYTSYYTSNGGIKKVLLNSDGSPDNKTIEFLNNAKYQFTNSHLVMTVLCADPSKKEGEAIIYTGVTFKGSGSNGSAIFDDIGLWSYYPTRGNWNRE